jgi:hypothetical protein
VEIILRPRKGSGRRRPVIKPRIKPLDILMRPFFPSPSPLSCLSYGARCDNRQTDGNCIFHLGGCFDNSSVGLCDFDVTVQGTNERTPRRQGSLRSRSKPTRSFSVCFITGSANEFYPGIITFIIIFVRTSGRKEGARSKLSFN